MIKNVLIVVLVLVALLLAVGLMSAQVTPLPDRTVGMGTELGADGKYYTYCLGNCSILLEVADVTEIYTPFDTAMAARVHGMVLISRSMGVPVTLLPGDSFTPVPGTP